VLLTQMYMRGPFYVPFSGLEETWRYRAHFTYPFQVCRRPGATLLGSVRRHESLYGFAYKRRMKHSFNGRVTVLVTQGTIGDGT
jgi:hypothetical protein